MPKTVDTAFEMISGMTPELQPGTYVFISTTKLDVIAALTTHALATFKENEGLSMLVPMATAINANLNVDHPMRCITLNVYSSLIGVGLTAAVSKALGDKGIPCNMIAACHHDHVFVPADMCDQALDILASLQKQATNRI